MQLLSFLPIFAYLLVVKLLDDFVIVTWRRLAVCGIVGMMVGGLIFLASNMIDIPDNLFPLIEEIGKGAFIIYLISRRKIVFFVEGLCYGAAVGGGFAIIENLLYIIYNSGMTDTAVAFRGLGTALLHMGCTSLLAVSALSFSKILSPIPGLMIHYLYNMFFLPVSSQLVITIILFLVIFLFIGLYNDKRIYKWMDNSIINDIQLLSDIRNGRLADSAIGGYLASIKDHFPPEVFFDLICYIQLYLELLVKGKSDMLLKQEGLLPPPSEADQQLRDSMKEELHTLEKRIGYMGKHLLRPILRFDKEDIKLIG